MTQMLRSYSKYETHAGKEGPLEKDNFSRKPSLVLSRGKKPSHTSKVFHKEKGTSVYGKNSSVSTRHKCLISLAPMCAAGHLHRPPPPAEEEVVPTEAVQAEEAVVVEDGTAEGMSSGQVVGIVIGALIAVIIAIAVVIAVVRRMGKYSNTILH
ncbi:hypothetical protein KUCAC02_012519 [Chaenocephalus aceratus]|uniref:Uncharacterized protein n=1 Tax=Chaenocephalus aceratus TaxID=36190 RepID=A0ACB9XAZ2_CHAAC|nr:hypothetical protein KUCAC02_012519 [Chaenocephalus aceratus]